jgi:putative transposase
MSHTYSTKLVHCVVSTKDRIDAIQDATRERLYAYVFGTARNLEIEILALGGTANHIHIMMALPAKWSLSDAVRDLKANSSRWMSENGPRFCWQKGFGGFSVSPSQAGVVKEYIRNQVAYHKKRNFEEELVVV